MLQTMMEDNRLQSLRVHDISRYSVEETAALHQCAIRRFRELAAVLGQKMPCSGYASALAAPESSRDNQASSVTHDAFNRRTLRRSQWRAGEWYTLES